MLTDVCRRCVLSDFLTDTDHECKLCEDLYIGKRRLIKSLDLFNGGFFYHYLLLDNELGIPINLQQWREPVIIIIISFETVVELE